MNLALRLEGVIKEMARKNMEIRKGDQLGTSSQIVGKLSPIHTNKKLAEIAGVSDLYRKSPRKPNKHPPKIGHILTASGTFSGNSDKV